MNPEDFEYAGDCAVCGEMLDMSEAGFCAKCGRAFCWSGCGGWGESGHECHDCTGDEE
jgi:hypothetical protein